MPIDSEDQYTISICVLNALLALIAIALNSASIHAIRKTSTALPKTLRALLLSVAVSDLGVGLMVQPLYLVALVFKTKTETTENDPTTNILTTTSKIVSFLFPCASVLSVLALSVDRFLAVHLHLRYKEIVTHKRVVAGVTSIWVLSVIISILPSRWPITEDFAVYIFDAAIIVACLVATTVIHCKIYTIVRRHRNAIRSLQVQKTLPQDVKKMAIDERQKHSFLGTFYIYLVCLVCYLPYCCIIMVFKLSPRSTALLILTRCSVTLFFLNSCLNPLIYCWKLKPIRSAVVGILRKVIFPRASDGEDSYFNFVEKNGKEHLKLCSRD